MVRIWSDTTLAMIGLERSPSSRCLWWSITCNDRQMSPTVSLPWGSLLRHSTFFRSVLSRFFEKKGLFVSLRQNLDLFSHWSRPSRVNINGWPALCSLLFSLSVVELNSSSFSVRSLNLFRWSNETTLQPSSRQTYQWHCFQIFLSDVRVKSAVDHLDLLSFSLCRTKAANARRLKSRADRQTRRHSLRLSPIIKQVKARPIMRATGRFCTRWHLSILVFSSTQMAKGRTRQRRWVTGVDERTRRG